MNLILVLFFVAGFLCPESAFAGGSIVNWYDEAYRAVSGANYNAHASEQFVVIAGGIFTLSVCTIMGLFYSKAVAASGDDVVPSERFGLRTIVELVMDLVVGLAKENLGSSWRVFSPLLAGLFLYICVSNLGGLIPGFIPVTESLSNNLAMGLTVFLVYNISGFKEHGFHYLKQFTGPMLAIAPIMFIIEIFGHAFRPISLSLRLMGNIFADHLLVGIFTSVAPHILIPSVLMFFGVLVALVQSFVFTLLTCVYISLAVSHDH